ncbi:Rhodanese-like protein [Metschnikowia bicuspidata var. bicuspidata NRRL YB-4993]|uniref:M-phase inducer phosphatase n=1 Tax=Metschnikowia bicuspidata var. bicuspidata NRRL YB-4993 TaxID=869754 RepID=A0A1A0HFT1_9ASCO|nr:Rhodanese-like protein [Metschnikowia bicuspidata var. bicuspidata NRRL YB-4993]OBA22713.1 Rhodanese-like protein [Metschnikowia bicuspidata var. bicuspidata NRRL YB-4993]
MKNEHVFSHLAQSCPRNKDPVPTAAPRHKFRTRNPLESLLLYVNSLEIRAVGSKISHSASSIRRSVSHRFSDLPLFPEDDTSDDFDETNDSTLIDEDWLASPSLKQKTASPCIQPSFVEEASPRDHFTSNAHLPNTCIKTFTVAQDNLPRIDENEMRKIVEGAYADQFDEFVTIDCRFPYEYEGGHIAQAINVSLQQILEEQFLSEASTQSSCRKLLIFHCEYSVLRGPTLATHLRKADRHLNAHRYPYLHYPDIVILDRGYKGFFDKFRHLCDPQSYVAMKDTNHKRTCEIEMSKVMQASKLTRAKSFNQFPPRLNLAHTRSASLTALLTGSDTSSSANTAPLPRSRRSLKIKKRDRKDSRPQFSQSLLNFLNACDSPEKDAPMYSRLDNEEFLPPTALFRNHSKSSSGLLLSVNSSLLLICSEALSPTFSSSESLLESASPFNDRPDFYKSLSAFDIIDFTTPLSSVNSYNFAQDPQSKTTSIPPGTPATQKALGLTLSRPTIRPGLKQEGSSPTFSSPLSINAASTYASRQDASSMSDSLNDAPVDYFLQPKTLQHRRLARAGNHHNQSSNLGHVGE